MKGNDTRYTATAIGKAEYLKVIGCDLYDVVSGRSIDAVPGICSVKIHLIALVSDKIRSVVWPECVRRGACLVLFADRICSIEIN